jgi:hypothetical protein
MTWAFYLAAAIYTVAALGLGFWCGMRFMYAVVLSAVKKAVQERGFIEIKGVRFIAVAVNPNPPTPKG